MGICIFDVFLFFGYLLSLYARTRRWSILRHYAYYLDNPNFWGLFNGDIKIRERTKIRAKYVIIASFIAAIVAALEPFIFWYWPAILFTLIVSVLLYIGGSFYYTRCIADEVLEKEIARRRKSENLKIEGGDV